MHITRVYMHVMSYIHVYVHACRYVPPVCQEDPYSCVEIYHVNPTYSEGLVEQVGSVLGLSGL